MLKKQSNLFYYLSQGMKKLHFTFFLHKKKRIKKHGQIKLCILKTKEKFLMIKTKNVPYKNKSFTFFIPFLFNFQNLGNADVYNCFFLL